MPRWAGAAAVESIVWMSGEQRIGPATGPGPDIGPRTTSATGTTQVQGTTSATIMTGQTIVSPLGVGRNALDLSLDLSALESFGEIVLPPPFAVHEGLYPAGPGPSVSPSLALAAFSSTFATPPTGTPAQTPLEQPPSRQHDLHTPEPVSTPPAFQLTLPTGMRLQYFFTSYGDSCKLKYWTEHRRTENFFSVFASITFVERFSAHSRAGDVYIVH